MVNTVNKQHTVRGNTKEKIVTAAIDLCLTGGLASVSMRSIASLVGISATAIYRHYRNREEVIDALVSHANSIFSKYIEPPTGTDRGLPRVATISRGYLDFYLREPRLYGVLFDTRDRKDIGALPEEVESENFALFVSSISESMTLGHLEPDDPVGVAITLWAYFHGIVLLHRAGRFNQSTEAFEALFDRGSQRLLTGLSDAVGQARWRNCWSPVS